MKSLGYSTGQFGKNHLGDRNEHLPTVHGFDEFFGNLYHLNAEEEPQNPDYPKDPKFRARFGPRGVLRCKASDKDDPTIDPAYGKVGKQVIENTGALDTKRMETIDEEFLSAAKGFIQRQHKAGKPWFCSDNGAECCTWPDGGATPFRGEKATNWEGGFRVPMLIRWPGAIKAGTIVNDVCAHEDFMPTLAAAAGEPNLVDKLKEGHSRPSAT